MEALQHDIVNALACGDGQTIAVTVDGNVWGWGCFKDKEGKKFSNPPFDASNPQPWKSIKAQQNLPVQIPELRNIVDVACGASFCVARSATGSAYSWGLGESGELGRPVKPLKDSSGEYDTKQIYHDHIKPGENLQSSKAIISDMSDKYVSCGQVAYRATQLTDFFLICVHCLLSCQGG